MQIFVLTLQKQKLIRLFVVALSLCVCFCLLNRRFSNPQDSSALIQTNDRCSLFFFCMLLFVVFEFVRASLREYFKKI